MVFQLNVAEAVAVGVLPLGTRNKADEFLRHHAGWIQSLVILIGSALNIPLNSQGKLVCLTWLRQFIERRHEPGYHIARIFQTQKERQFLTTVWNQFETDILGPLDGAQRLMALSRQSFSYC